MPFILRGLTPDDFAFREIAFAMLSLAAGLSSTLKVVDRLRIRSSSSTTWDGIILGDQSQNEVVVLSQLAMGHHAEDIAPGSAPEAQTYWFQSAVIRLEADLTTPDRIEHAIKHAIAFAKGYQYLQEPFDVVLLSIEHVILVHVVGNNVQRTVALPLLDIAVHYTQHPSRRYPEGALEQFTDAHKAKEEKKEREKKEEKLRRKEHKRMAKRHEIIRDGKEMVEEDEVQAEKKEDSVEPQHEESESESADGDEMELVEEEEDSFDPQHEDSENESADGDETKPWPIALEGFFAMMHLFEAATVRSMAPEKAKEGIFPTEVYEIILEYVDNATYQACACVSRKFRRCCLRALRLVEDTVIHGLTPNAGAMQSWNTSSFILSHGTQGTRLPYQFKPLGDYGRRTGRQGSTIWIIICGLSQRSTRLSSFLFLDYEIPSTWHDLGQQNKHELYHQNNLVEDEALQYRRSLLTEKNSTHYWNQRRVVAWLRPLAQIDTRQRRQMWAEIVESYDMEKRYDDNRFVLPPHTKEVIIETLWLNIWVGYIRIKRPDAVVGLAEAWDLALMEAEAEVVERVQKQDYQQISVVVAIEFSAMLYRWNAETQELQATHSDRLNVFAEGDREMVEEFLLAMKEPLAEQQKVDRKHYEKVTEERQRRGSDTDSD
ncbi:cyclic nucleotide gated channel beta 1 [Xylographa soralifera]|nr:cyclic nucleotide gated channel beta 1 [Xylographa soralifera]